MSYISVFVNPKTQAPWSLQFNGKTLEEEVHHAKELDGLPEYGEFLYSRTISQKKIVTGQRYVFDVVGVHLSYYLSTESARMAPFDYYGINQQIDVIHRVHLGQLKAEASVTIRLNMDFLDSAKFKRFCNKYYFSVEIDEGGVSLFGYDKPDSSGPSVQIPVPYEVL